MPDKPGLLSLYSDVQTKPVSWLWFPYIAYGKLTVLQGDPGDGKSYMMLHLIAEISRGGAMPDGTALNRCAMGSCPLRSTAAWALYSTFPG